MSPPRFEDISKLIKLALKPILGEISIEERPHRGLTIATWILPVAIKFDATPPPIEDIMAALKLIDGTPGIRLLAAKIDQSEAPESGSRGPSASVLSPEGRPERPDLRPVVGVSGRRGGLNKK
jgi:hypothetical protein